MLDNNKTEEQIEAERKYMREYMCNYYKKHREKMLAKQKEWNKKNKEHVNGYARDYRENNMEKVRAYYRKYNHNIRSDDEKKEYDKLIREGDGRVGARSVEARKKVRDGIAKAKAKLKAVNNDGEEERIKN